MTPLYLLSKSDGTIAGDGSTVLGTSNIITRAGIVVDFACCCSCDDPVEWRIIETSYPYIYNVGSLDGPLTCLDGSDPSHGCCSGRQGGNNTPNPPFTEGSPNTGQCPEEWCLGGLPCKHEPAYWEYPGYMELQVLCKNRVTNEELGWFPIDQWVVQNGEPVHKFNCSGYPNPCCAGGNLVIDCECCPPTGTGTTTLPPCPPVVDPNCPPGWGVQCVEYAEVHPGLICCVKSGCIPPPYTTTSTSRTRRPGYDCCPRPPFPHSPDCGKGQYACCIRYVPSPIQIPQCQDYGGKPRMCCVEWSCCPSPTTTQPPPGTTTTTTTTNPPFTTTTTTTTTTTLPPTTTTTKPPIYP